MFFGERAQDFQIQLFITIISASTELPFFFSKNRDHDTPQSYYGLELLQIRTEQEQRRICPVPQAVG